MKEFENNKNKDIIPRILGGLSISSGVLMIFLLVVSIPFLFIPTFKFYKILLIPILLLIVYSILNFIDVSNNGMQNIFKKLFTKNITAIKIKHTPKLIKDDSKH